MFYDEQGKHVRTKKEILDENGEVRKGCKIVKKSEVYERNLFATKKIGKNNSKAEQIQTDNGYYMRWNCEVDRAIVSGVAETEIQQIKQEYITDRIRESIDVFGSQPERFGTIFMSAVAVLAMLISKVLQKARELSIKLFDTERIQPETPKQEPVQKPAEKNAKQAEDTTSLSCQPKQPPIQSCLRFTRN